MKENSKARKDYLSWDEYFMSVAKLSSMRSKDPNTQVGAVQLVTIIEFYQQGITERQMDLKMKYFLGDEKEIHQKQNIYMQYMQKEMQY